MYDYERHPFIHGWPESIEKKSVLITLNICIWGNLLFGIFIDRLRATHVLDGGAMLILIVGLATNYHVRYLGGRFWFNLQRFGGWLVDDGAEIGGEILSGLLKFLWGLVWNRNIAALALAALFYAPFYFFTSAQGALSAAICFLCGVTGAAIVYGRMKVRQMFELREERDRTERAMRNLRADHGRELAAAKQEASAWCAELAKHQRVSINILTAIQKELDLDEYEMANVLSALPYLKIIPDTSEEKLTEMTEHLSSLLDDRQTLLTSMQEAARKKKAREDASTQ